jgi:catechol 2,3-dioxygenase-like lactoylglutathione lyase family enzyme
MQIRLDHAVIHVSDWKRSNDFYRRVLGAELIGETDGPCRYRFGRQQLNVHGPGVEPYPLARLPVEPGNSDLCFEWEGPIEEAVEHLQRQGIEIEAGPVERHGARGTGMSVYFRDPDGSLLEFISYAA